MRKGSQGTPGTTRRNDERSAALRAVKDVTGRGGSRNQSPVRSDVGSPGSGTQTPVETSMSPTPAVDEDKMRKVTKSTVEEFFGVQDYKVFKTNNPLIYYMYLGILVLTLCVV